MDSAFFKVAQFPTADESAVRLSFNRLHHNLYQVTLTGGEPLLFKADVMLIAREAKRLGVPMVIVTNARMLDEEFLTEYKALGHILVISVDSVERAKWNEFRGRISFDPVMLSVCKVCNQSRSWYGQDQAA